MRFLKNLRKDELLRGGIILFVAINIFNFFNYLFHFSMGRLLGPAGYGVFAALMSIAYFFMIPSEAIQTIISRYTSRYLSENKPGKIKNLLKKSLVKGIKLAVVLYIAFLPVAFFLSKFLMIRLSLILITALFLIPFLTIPAERGVLQGMKKMKELGINLVVESIAKISLGVMLVVIGFGVFGAVTGILLGLTITIFAALIHLRGIINKKPESIDGRSIYSYGKPVFIVISSIVMMYSMDIILAKRFFPPEIVGKYAVASMLGKMIFFGTSAVGKAMFPLTSERNDSKKDSTKLFNDSLKIVLLLSTMALLLFLLFPKLVITIFYGGNYADVSNILFIVGLSFTFISVANLIILYRLSGSKIKKSYYSFFIISAIQITLLSVSNASLLQYSIALLASSFLMLIYSIIIK